MCSLLFYLVTFFSLLQILLISNQVMENTCFILIIFYLFICLFIYLFIYFYILLQTQNSFASLNLYGY